MTLVRALRTLHTLGLGSITLAKLTPSEIKIVEGYAVIQRQVSREPAVLDAVRTILAWGFSGAPDQPLLPLVPGQTAPMTSRWIYGLLDSDVDDVQVRHAGQFAAWSATHGGSPDHDGLIVLRGQPEGALARRYVDFLAEVRASLPPPVKVPEPPKPPKLPGTSASAIPAAVPHKRAVGRPRKTPPVVVPATTASEWAQRLRQASKGLRSPPLLVPPPTPPAPRPQTTPSPQAPRTPAPPPVPPLPAPPRTTPRSNTYEQVEGWLTTAPIAFTFREVMRGLPASVPSREISDALIRAGCRKPRGASREPTRGMKVGKWWHLPLDSDDLPELA